MIFYALLLALLAWAGPGFAEIAPTTLYWCGSGPAPKGMRQLDPPCDVSSGPQRTNPRSAVTATVKAYGDGLTAIVTDANGKVIPTECEHKMEAAMRAWDKFISYGLILPNEVDYANATEEQIASVKLWDAARKDCWRTP